LCRAVRPHDLQVDVDRVLAETEMKCQVVLVSLAGARKIAINDTSVGPFRTEAIEKSIIVNVSVDAGKILRVSDTGKNLNFIVFPGVAVLQVDPAIVVVVPPGDDDPIGELDPQLGGLVDERFVGAGAAGRCQQTNDDQRSRLLLHVLISIAVSGGSEFRSWKWSTNYGIPRTFFQPECAALSLIRAVLSWLLRAIL
jgi:hypothetical protein